MSAQSRCGLSWQRAKWEQRYARGGGPQQRVRLQAVNCECGGLFVVITAKCVPVCVCARQEKLGGKGRRGMRAGSSTVWNTHHVPDKDQLSYIRAQKKRKENSLCFAQEHTQMPAITPECQSVCVFVCVHVCNRQTRMKEEARKTFKKMRQGKKCCSHLKNAKPE